MKQFIIAAALAALVGVGATAALAGATDYKFEPVSPEMKTGENVIVSLRLTDKAGKPVTDAVIVRMRVDMAPDGMAEMTSAVALVSNDKPGVYALKTDLPMAGRYLVTVAAKVQGEPETVTGKVIIKAVK